MDVTAKRLRAMLAEAARRYPGVWRQIDAFRADRGRGDLPDWPDWCFLPIAGTYAIVGGSRRLPPERVPDPARLAALAAWRVTQGIYRFDPELYAALVSTELKGDLPADLLKRLPAWGVYIEMQQPDLQGFFAHLEHDVNTGRMELRLVLDAVEDDGGLIPIPLHVGKWNLARAIEEMMTEAHKQATLQGYGQYAHSASAALDRIARGVAPMLSLLLYLCSESAD